MSELLCDPKELAKRIVDYREQNAVVFNFIGGPILLDRAIEEAIQLVYHASLLPEEGRYPRFRVVFTNQSFGHGIQLVESWLGHRIESPDSIRRLAPAVGGRETALLIGPGPDNGLAAWRIVDFEQFCAGQPMTSNRLSDIVILPNGVLFLRVNGPGDVRAMIHPSPVFHLRGGKIRTLKSLNAVKPFCDLVLDLCTELHNSVKDEKRIEVFVPNPKVFTDDFADLWAASLSTAIEGRHGGAFAIVASPDCPQLKMKYKVEGGLFTAFRETLQLCLDSTDSSGPRYLAIFKQFWQSHQNHLRRVAKSIGQLAATDGCVVFDRELQVKGFGAKIDLPNDTTFLPLIDTQSNESVSDEEIEKTMGTRHKSACRLAQVAPGAIIFVVSQDGDLTVFYSDESCAYRIRDLDAWSSVSEMI